MTGGAELLDLATALERVGGDRRLLAEIARLFLGEYPQILKEIRAAMEAGDASRTERAAHNLKGSAANFGAESAVEAAFAVEKLGRAGDLNSAAAAFQRLEREMHNLQPALEQLAASVQRG